MDAKQEVEDNAQTIRPGRSPASGPVPLPLAKAPSPGIHPISEDFSDQDFDFEDDDGASAAAEIASVASSVDTPLRDAVSARPNWQRPEVAAHAPGGADTRANQPDAARLRTSHAISAGTNQSTGSSRQANPSGSSIDNSDAGGNRERPRTPSMGGGFSFPAGVSPEFACRCAYTLLITRILIATARSRAASAALGREYGHWIKHVEQPQADRGNHAVRFFCCRLVVNCTMLICAPNCVGESSRRGVPSRAWVCRILLAVVGLSRREEDGSRSLRWRLARAGTSSACDANDGAPHIVDVDMETSHLAVEFKTLGSYGGRAQHYVMLLRVRSSSLGLGNTRTVSES